MSADGFTEPVMAWITDMSLTPKRVSGALRVGHRLARRLRTPRGRCLGHPNDGTDMSDLLQSTMTQSQARTAEQAIRAEVLKDVSVSRAVASVQLSADGHVVTISVRAFGEFGSTSVTFETLTDGTLAVKVT